jgi:hypothetical protein
MSAFASQLIVSSKHALNSDHAQKARAWVSKMFKKREALLKELLLYLEEQDLTAVFEVSAIANQIRFVTFLK